MERSKFPTAGFFYSFIRTVSKQTRGMSFFTRFKPCFFPRSSVAVVLSVGTYALKRRRFWLLLAIFQRSHLMCNWKLQKELSHSRDKFISDGGNDTNTRLFSLLGQCSDNAHRIDTTSIEKRQPFAFSRTSLPWAPCRPTAPPNNLNLNLSFSLGTSVGGSRQH